MTHKELADQDALFCELALRAKLLTVDEVALACERLRAEERESIAECFIAHQRLSADTAKHLQGLVQALIETCDAAGRSRRTLLTRDDADAPSPELATQQAGAPAADAYQTLPGSSDDGPPRQATEGRQAEAALATWDAATEHPNADADQATRSPADYPTTGPVNSTPDGPATIGDPSGDAESTTAAAEPLATRDPMKTRPPSSASPTSTLEAVRFRVLGKHAEGGLGKVLRAVDCDFQREVAVKEIKERFADNKGSRDRFLFEAMVTGRLEHPGICPVYALGHYPDGRPYYAMRFIGGDSLAKRIKQLHASQGDSFDRQLRHLLNQFVSVCNTIEYAHSRRIVHRDLKPDNIMLGEYGETLVVDWGLAKSLDSPAAEPAEVGSPGDGDSGVDKTRAGEVVGTPQFMPPEQAAGDVESIAPASDIYSLGATLFQLVTGATPIQHKKGSSVDLLLEKVRSGDLRAAADARPGTPRALAAICAKAMQRQMEERYASARELGQDIENYLADERVSVLRETPFQVAGRWMRKHRSWAQAIGAALALVAVVASVATVITQGALKETQQQKDRADRQRKVAELMRDFDNAMSQEEKRLTELAPDIPLQQTPMPVSLVASLESQIKRIEALTGEEDLRRNRLLEVWSDSLEKLAQRRMTDDAGRFFREQIDRLEARFPWHGALHSNAVTRLRNLHDRRLADWYPLETGSFADAGFHPGTPASSWRRNRDQAPTALLAECLPGNIQVACEFSRDWRTAPAVGLALNAEADRRYEILVADAQYDPVFGFDSVELTLDEANEKGRLRLFICRDDQILRSAPIRVDSINLRLRAVRESVTRLTAQAEDSEVVFHDAFPLPPKSPGMAGVICPADHSLLTFDVQHQRQEAAVSAPELELGDQLFAQQKYPEARQQYAAAPDSAEAAFKIALCYEYENERKQYLAALRDVLDSHAPASDAEAYAAPWPLFAGVRLLSEAIASDGEVYGVVETLDKIKIHYTLQDVARLIPTTQQRELLAQVAKPGQRYRIAFGNREDEDDLREALTIHDALDGDPLSRRQAKWRLADALRTQGETDTADRRTKARKVMHELLEELEGLANVDEVERATLLSDFVWMEIVDQRYEEAEKLIAPYLLDDMTQAPPEHMPLLIDRARLHYLQGRAEEAREDLEHFVDYVDPRGSGLVTPPQGIHYSHFSEACALLGMMYEEVEAPPRRPHVVWMRGRRRNWGPGYPTIRDLRHANGAASVLEAHWAEPILAGWTRGQGEGGYLPVEMKKEVELIFAGSAIGDSAIRNIVKNTEILRDEWLKVVMETVNRGDRGRAAGRDALLRRISLLEFHEQGALMILYQAILQVTFGGDEALDKYPGLDPLLYAQCDAIIQNFQEHTNGKPGIDQKDMGMILKGWSAAVRIQDEPFRELAEKLDDPALSTGLAVVFGVMQVKYGDLEFGRKFLQKHVLDQTGPDIPQLYHQIVKDELAKAERAARDEAA